MAQLTHIVLRPFDGPEGRLKAGARVDASGWKNERTLVATRYMRPLGPADAAAQAPRKG